MLIYAPARACGMYMAIVDVALLYFSLPQRE